MTGKHTEGHFNAGGQTTTIAITPTMGAVGVDSQAKLPEDAEIDDLRERRLFISLDRDRKGHVTRQEITRALARAGLDAKDSRLRECMVGLTGLGDSDLLEYDQFCRIIRPNILLIEQALQGTLVIPDFEEFAHEIEQIYTETRTACDGDLARYIHQLAVVDPEQYAIALCTVDGQRYETGDSHTDFCVQSCCKPINYCLALEECGEEVVHSHVGREPSGHGFNEIALNAAQKPHNPMINAGAIMCCSLIRQDADMAGRFEHVMERWKSLCGDDKVRFSNSVYLSERATADRNFALGYFLREKQAFPANTDLVATLEFYFQCCSIEATAAQLSIAAATLANGGICPTTGKRIFQPKTVQHCLSLMYSCGMYDFSGEFAFTIGLPAKSGVSGALMIVVPNVMGICTWSPRIDNHGNSVRGLAFCRKLVEKFRFHNYDNLRGLHEKHDPRQPRIRVDADVVMALIWAASKGDLSAIQRLVACGADLNGADYDGRTPLHLAASEGHEDVVRYFIDQGVNINPVDRWGGTPLCDAQRHGHEVVMELLERSGGTAIINRSASVDRPIKQALEPRREAWLRKE
ncbi:MAG TPA: glutaminase A [Kofleriaceae bacterium]